MKPGVAFASGILLALAGACSSTPSVRARELRAATADGVDIAYEDRGEGEPVLVLVHCWAGDRSFWREQTAEFSRDHRVLALDLSGHGQSGAHASWSLDALAGDVLAVLDEARVERCVLIGHSLGGPVSLRVAALARERVIAVVGVETLHDVERRPPAERIDELIAAFAADFPGIMRKMIRSMLPAKTPNELVEWITRKACAADAERVLAISRALAQVDPKELLAEAGVPVRCINSAPGSASIQATSVEHNRAVADFDAVLIEGTGHFPQLERPIEFNRELRGVLDGLLRD